MEKKLKIEGMHCKSCEVLLVDILSELKGIKSVKADSAKGEIIINYESPNTLDAAKTLIEKEKYRVIE